MNLGLKIPLLNVFVKGIETTGTLEGYSFFVPLGISYYSMSLVGYMADVYWKKEKFEKNIFKLLLFALYFPKILQGPISKYRNISKTLFGENKFDYTHFCYGLQRMLWGYFKKLVIADRVALIVTPVFENYESYHGTVLLVASIFGAFQLYCDFSGCMDIALGISESLGIKLEENFNHPFFSKTAAEFWRRWHMTLGSWFKDYIYMPIVISPTLIKLSGKLRKRFGKRVGKEFVTIVPLAIVWTLTGLWHGTGWNYVVWGIYWGIIMIISTVFEPELKKIPILLHIKTDSMQYQIFRQIRTFSLFVISRIITIPSDIKASVEVFKRVLFDQSPWELVDGTLFKLGLDGPNFILLILALLLLYFVSRCQEKGIMIRDKIASFPIFWRWTFYYMAIFAVLIFGIYGAGYDASSFVYMNY